MRTNIVIDDQLLAEALKLSRAKTKKEVVHKALREFVRNKKKLDLKELKGRVRFAEGYNYKKMRSR
jgi:Arc/MetJ family transcription regulator